MDHLSILVYKKLITRHNRA